MYCTTQLACVAHDICRNIDKRVPTHAVVLDFSNAFDMVPHHQCYFSKLLGLLRGLPGALSKIVCTASVEANKMSCLT